MREAPDVFADASSLTRDLAVIENLQWFRKAFFERVCERSATPHEDVISVLRMEATYQIAEFFYLLRALLHSINRTHDLAPPVTCERCCGA